MDRLGAFPRPLCRVLPPLCPKGFYFTDVIIANPPLACALDVAERLGARLLYVFPFPYSHTPTSYIKHPFTYGNRHWKLDQVWGSGRHPREGVGGVLRGTGCGCGCGCRCGCKGTPLSCL